MSSYVKQPINKVPGHCYDCYEDILNELKGKSNNLVCIEAYPGTDDLEILTEFKKLEYDCIIETKELFLSKADYAEKSFPYVTDDRIFGRMCSEPLENFMDSKKVKDAKKSIVKGKRVLVYGFGASIVMDNPDILILADLARWEIQQRFRSGMSNYMTDNVDEDVLSKFKRGYFFEWRVADKIKMKIFNKIDYLLDTNKANHPKMISGKTFRNALDIISQKPFRTVPYFDAGVWGGNWMEEKFDLENGNPNYAWCFDGVPEENSLLLGVGGSVVEIPSIDLILYKPIEVLGEKVYTRFGAEWPIRFDYLDTMGGQNLSLQVHPIVDYIKREFGMAYTQEESYYLMDAKDDACVYLGLKENINQNEMIEALYDSKESGYFDVEKYINKFPVRKHDHILIPSGTVHCSGSNAVVLEISTTPYIFTFKLYDWGRVGLDGKPRPINIDHGKEVIDWNKTTQWVNDHLINAIDIVAKDDDCVEEHTGFYENEFIETRRYWTSTISKHNAQNNCAMANLVEGSAAVIESPKRLFDPFEVHFGETFILPSTLGEYTIRPKKKGEKIGIVKAYVRN